MAFKVFCTPLRTPRTTVHTGPALDPSHQPCKALLFAHIKPQVARRVPPLVSALADYPFLSKLYHPGIVSLNEGSQFHSHGLLTAVLKPPSLNARLDPRALSYLGSPRRSEWLPRNPAVEPPCHQMPRRSPPVFSAWFHYIHEQEISISKSAFRHLHEREASLTGSRDTQGSGRTMCTRRRHSSNSREYWQRRWGQLP